MPEQQISDEEAQRRQRRRAKAIERVITEEFGIMPDDDRAYVDELRRRLRNLKVGVR